VTLGPDRWSSSAVHGTDNSSIRRSCRIAHETIVPRFGHADRYRRFAISSGNQALTGAFPPNQASYTSTPGVNGWASYKVADGVTTHEARGLGVYSVFIYPDVGLTRAIETPKSPEVRFHDMITVALGDTARSTM
jgi:hypothetical protein